MFLTNLSKKIVYFYWLLFTSGLFLFFGYFFQSTQAVGCPLPEQNAYKAPNSSAVYYITKQCTKRPFRSAKKYFTYFYSWNEVTHVSSYELASIPKDHLGFMPAGPLYDPKYGALVKTVDDPKVYLLLGNEKYWITDESVFNKLGYSWNWIEDIDQRLLNNYFTGSEINYTNRHPNYTIVKYPDSADVYRLEPDPTDASKQIKKHIKDEKEFNSFGFRWDRIVVIDKTEQYNTGSGGSSFVKTTQPAQKTVQPIQKTVVKKQPVVQKSTPQVKNTPAKKSTNTADKSVVQKPQTTQTISPPTKVDTPQPTIQIKDTRTKQTSNQQFVVNQTGCPWTNRTITVVSNGQPVSNALVTVYGRDSEMDPLHVTPFNIAFGNSNIEMTAKTNSQGKAVLDGNLLKSEIHTIVASAPGYITKFIPNRYCNLVQDTTLSLYSLQSFKKSPSSAAQQNRLPARVDTNGTYWSQYEVAGREIILPFTPIVRDDILANSKQIDLTMKIVDQPTAANGTEVPAGLTKFADENFYYEQTLNNIKIGQIHSFKYTLDEGAYYFYFTFTVTNNNGTKQTYDFYPSYVGWGLTPVNHPDVEKFDSWRYRGNVLVYPAMNVGTFSPVLQGQNNSNENRVNIVFLNIGFDDNLFQQILSYVTTDAKLSLLNVEPIKSNKNKFNFWKYNTKLTVDEATWEFGNFSSIFFGWEKLSKSQEMYLSHNFKGKTIFYAMIDDDSLTQVQTRAVSGQCTFNKGVTFGIASQPLKNCLASKTAPTCFKEFQVGRVVLHELGHELGFLGEEYVDTFDLFNVDEYVKENKMSYTPNFRPNTYHSSSLDLDNYCKQFKYSGGGHFVNEIVCDDAPANACSQSSWSDLIGNGCGKDGVLDCSFNDPGFDQEVGCNFGGGTHSNTGSANLLKATRISVMDISKKFMHSFNKITEKSRVYGLGNERTLCRAIKNYTGSAAGVCSQLCIDGCAAGKSCINGSCQ